MPCFSMIDADVTLLHINQPPVLAAFTGLSYVSCFRQCCSIKYGKVQLLSCPLGSNWQVTTLLLLLLSHLHFHQALLSLC